MDLVAIRPCKDRRVILPDGGQTLDGLAVAPGSDCPADGALVEPGIWTQRRLDDEDAELVPSRTVKAGDRAAAKRETPPTDPAGTQS